MDYKIRYLHDAEFHAFVDTIVLWLQREPHDVILAVRVARGIQRQQELAEIERQLEKGEIDD